MKGVHLRPWQRSFTSILLLTLLVSGSAWLGIEWWKGHYQLRMSDERYNILAIVQSCDSKEPLQTDFLAELLQLSVDRPTNLYRFNTQAATQRLLACSIIKSAEVKKIVPSMLYIKYALRRPIAYMPEYGHAAIDEEGCLIPIQPFYTPKNLPEFILGHAEDLEWGSRVSQVKLSLAEQIIMAFSAINLGPNCRLKRVDVARAYSPRCGSRGIVLFFDEQLKEGTQVQKRLLSLVRFSLESWQEQLANYGKLHRQLWQEGQGALQTYQVDMRIAQLAIIGKV
jgi:hypothetical protein